MVLKTTIFAADQWPFFALDKTHTLHKFESRAVRFWSICKFWSRSPYWIYIKSKTETIDFKSCHWYRLFFNDFENHHFRCRPVNIFGIWQQISFCKIFKLGQRRTDFSHGTNWEIKFQWAWMIFRFSLNFKNVNISRDVMHFLGSYQNGGFAKRNNLKDQTSKTITGIRFF